MEKQLNESMSKMVRTHASQTITLGTDKTLSTCDTGNYDGSRYLLADWAANYSASGKWADVSTTAGGVGEATCWAWVGPQVYVSGPAGSKQHAYITFRGSYDGSILGGISGSSQGRVRVSVWDFTRGSEIAGAVVWEDTSQNDIAKYGRGSITQSIGVYLEAGHTYAFRFGVSVASVQYGVNISRTDFWNNGPGPEGVDAASVSVDF